MKVLNNISNLSSYYSKMVQPQKNSVIPSLEVSFKAHHLGSKERFALGEGEPVLLRSFFPYNQKEFDETVKKIKSKDVKKLLIEKHKEIESQGQGPKIIVERKHILDVAKVVAEIEKKSEISLEDIEHLPYYQIINKDHPDFTEQIKSEIIDNNLSPIVQDMFNDVKYNKLMILIQEHVLKDNNFYNDLYKKLYLDKIDITPENKSKCLNICKEYNTHIFVSKLSNNSTFLDAVKLEFDEWKQKSNDTAFYPYVINQNVSNQDDATAGGVGSLYPNLLWLFPYENELPSTLRHEMTHFNDKFIEIYHESADLTYDFEKIMPQKYNIEKLKKYIMSNEGCFDINLFKNDYMRCYPEFFKRDLKNCKYLKDLFKAGVVTSQEIYNNDIPYAYTNRHEFIAEAATGLSQYYSPELKQELINMGLPEYVFDMQCFDPLKQKNSIDNNQMLSYHKGKSNKSFIKMVCNEINNRKKLDVFFRKLIQSSKNNENSNNN